MLPDYGGTMPLYEYECNDCGATFEAMVAFKDADKMVCELCGSKHVDRLMSTFCSSVSSGGGGSAAAPACGGGGG